MENKEGCRDRSSSAKDPTGGGGTVWTRNSTKFSCSSVKLISSCTIPCSTSVSMAARMAGIKTCPRGFKAVMTQSRPLPTN
eukprot:scaffold1508_cov178-Amphora_coffeaeformis.AAC.3